MDVLSVKLLVDAHALERGIHRSQNDLVKVVAAAPLTEGNEISPLLAPGGECFRGGGVGLAVVGEELRHRLLVRGSLEVVGEHQAQVGFAGAVRSGEQVSALVPGIESTREALESLSVGGDGPVSRHTLHVAAIVEQLVIKSHIRGVSAMYLYNVRYGCVHGMPLNLSIIGSPRLFCHSPSPPLLHNLPEIHIIQLQT